MNQKNGRKNPKPSRFFLMFGAVWAIVGLPFFLIGLSMYNTNARFSSEGIKTTGTVISKRVETRWNSTDKRNETFHHVNYNFTPKSGATIEGTYVLGESDWENLKEGDPVEIEYLPSDPNQNRTVNNSEGIAAYIFLGVGLVSVLSGLGFILNHFMRGSQRTRLIRDGAIAEGEITAVAPSSLTINNVPQWQLHYTFKDYKGEEFQAVSEYLSPEDASLWKAGDKGRVRFDPAKPKRSVWVGNT